MSDWFNRVSDITSAGCVPHLTKSRRILHQHHLSRSQTRGMCKTLRNSKSSNWKSRGKYLSCVKHFSLANNVGRLQEEKASWDSLLAGLAGTISKESAADQTASSSSSADVNPSLLTEPEAALLRSITSQDDIVESAISRFQQATQGLELNIDNLADNVHKIGKVAEAVDELADRVQSEAAQSLEKREKDALERTGTEKVAVGDILRSLARSG